MHEVAQARRHILAAVAALPVGLIVGRTAWGQRATAPQPPQAVVWDRRLGDGRMPFQPSWSYAAANDPTKGTVHAARLTRVVEGIAGVEFVCDRDGPRLDIRLTQPDLALAGAAREARVPITLETSCRLCGGPIDNRPGAPIGSFDWNASYRRRSAQGHGEPVHAQVTFCPAGVRLPDARDPARFRALPRDLRVPDDGLRPGARRAGTGLSRVATVRQDAEAPNAAPRSDLAERAHAGTGGRRAQGPRVCGPTREIPASFFAGAMTSKSMASHADTFEPRLLVEKATLPRRMSYPLRTTVLAGALRVAGITMHTHLIYGFNRIYLFDAAFWPPRPNFPYERLYVRVYAVPAEQARAARDIMECTVVPEFVAWVNGILSLPVGSPIRREGQVFLRKLSEPRSNCGEAEAMH